MKWLISANGKMYDHATAFAKWGFIDWRQNLKYNIGDMVYIYCTKPIKKIMFKTVVEKESMSKEQIVDDSEYWYIREEYEKALCGKYARLRLVSQVDNDRLSLENLLKYGLNSAPQKGIKVSDELASYIDRYMNDYYSENIFPESDLSDNLYEGASYSITVNRYERSSIARKKCIEYRGTKCYICGFDFEEKYGKLGKDFIHIHHIVPLNEINDRYIIDYKNDLIPICPNCHAMLHREVDGKRYTWLELKEILKN